MTLTSTGDIPSFGKVVLPEAPDRVSSTRYEVLLRAQLQPGGDIATILAACDEHPAVRDVKLGGHGSNRTFKISVDTSRSRDAHRFTYQVIDGLLRAIKRKTQPDAITTPDGKPAIHKRQPVGRRH